MKKIISLSLVIILCFSLCACGSSKGMSEAVAMKLDGSYWKVVQSGGLAMWYFHDGRLENTTYIASMKISLNRAGNYEVTDKYIKLNWEDSDGGRIGKLYYTFENNTLKLFTDKNKENEMEYVS